MTPTPPAKVRALIRGLMASSAAGSRKAAKELEGLRRHKQLADIIDAELAAEVEKAVRAVGKDVGKSEPSPKAESNQSMQADTVSATALPANLHIAPRGAPPAALPPLGPQPLQVVPTREPHETPAEFRRRGAAGVRAGHFLWKSAEAMPSGPRRVLELQGEHAVLASIKIDETPAQFRARVTLGHSRASDQLSWHAGQRRLAEIRGIQSGKIAGKLANW